MIYLYDIPEVTKLNREQISNWQGLIRAGAEVKVNMATKRQHEVCLQC